MAARGVGLFDSSDDEEEFWGSQEKIFLLEAKKAIQMPVVRVIFPLVRPVNRKVAKNRKMKMQTKTRGLEIYEMH